MSCARCIAYIGVIGSVARCWRRVGTSSGGGPGVYGCSVAYSVEVQAAAGAASRDMLAVTVTVLHCRSAQCCTVCIVCALRRVCHCLRMMCHCPAQHAAAVWCSSAVSCTVRCIASGHTASRRFEKNVHLLAFMCIAGSRRGHPSLQGERGLKRSHTQAMHAVRQLTVHFSHTLYIHPSASSNMPFNASFDAAAVDRLVAGLRSKQQHTGRRSWHPNALPLHSLTFHCSTV